MTEILILVLMFVIFGAPGAYITYLVVRHNDKRKRQWDAESESQAPWVRNSEDLR
jgi:hypothetical protein